MDFLGLINGELELVGQLTEMMTSEGSGRRHILKKFVTVTKDNLLFSRIGRLRLSGRSGIKQDDQGKCEEWTNW